MPKKSETETGDNDERFPVWEALSEFFLDTELDDLDHDRIAAILVRSPYSINEIEEILYYEVYPECKWNLFCSSGAWTAFDPDWLMERIAPRKDKRPPFRFPPLNNWMIRDHWEEVSKRIEGKCGEKGGKIIHDEKSN